MYKWSLGERLDLSSCYSLFACIFLLFNSVNSLTYLGSTSLFNFSAILQRYSDIMGLPEKVQVPKSLDKKVGLKIEDGSFTWKTGQAATITNINLEVNPGELAIVIGTVGSGKSTLLNSLMHETVLVSGKHT